jgi:hypothetical protein
MAKRAGWVNPLLWVIALLVINALWTGVAQQEAPNEVNTELNFENFREVEIAPFLNSDAAMPARLTVSFASSTVDQANVSYTLRLDNETVVASWSGQLGEPLPSWEGDLEPGTYVMETQLEEGVTVEQHIWIQPFAPFQIYGHVLLSTLLVATAFLEQGLRRLAQRGSTDDVSKPEKSPFKSIQQGMPDVIMTEGEDVIWREPLR